MTGGPESAHGSLLSEDDTARPDEEAVREKRRLAYIDIGRAISALLVFYSHISVLWVQPRGETAPVIRFVDTLTSNPMHMANQGIGQIGVPFFFLVSGYVVTPIAVRMGSVRFGINRLLRIYPPFIVTILLAALVLSIGLTPLSTGQEQTVTPLTILTNATLVNYLLVPQIVFVGVAWTLIVEIIFYILLALIIPLLKKWVWLALAIELTFVFIVLMSRKQFGGSYFLFSVSVSYLPIIIIGQIIWAAKAKKIPIWAAGPYLAAAWSLYVLADILQLGRLDSSYNLALAFAVVCFLLGMFAEPFLRERKSWIVLSERAYSLYLLHGVVAFAMLDLLRGFLPFWAALPVAIGVTFGMVELCYRLVEKPSHELARKLSRRPSPRVAEEEPEEPPADRSEQSSEQPAERPAERLPRERPESPEEQPERRPVDRPSAPSRRVPQPVEADSSGQRTDIMPAIQARRAMTPRPRSHRASGPAQPPTRTAGQLIPDSPGRPPEPQPRGTNGAQPRWPEENHGPRRSDVTEQIGGLARRLREQDGPYRPRHARRPPEE